VRLFSQWPHGRDDSHEELPRGLVPYRYCRTHPYIFTAAQITTIVEEAARLPSIYGMRGLTCSTLFGLIAVTGMRINEALSLNTGDVDLDIGVVRIWFAKFGKKRLLPLHDSVVERLRAYIGARDNGLEPKAYIADVIAKIAGDWPAARWDELMPWHWRPDQQQIAEAACSAASSPRLRTRPVSAAGEGFPGGGGEILR
jgi:integrase